MSAARSARLRARRRAPLLGVLAAAAAGGPAAADPGALTLAEAVGRALEQSPAARIAALESDRARHAAGETRSAYLPQVGLRSEAGYSNRFDEKLVAGDGAGNVRQYSQATLGADRAWLEITISQMLVDLKRWQEIERDEIAADVARLAETRDRDDVAYEVTRRYTQLLRRQRLAEAAHEQRVDAQWLVQQADLLFDAGRALEVDRRAARLALEQAEVELRAREQGVDAAEADLWLALGEAEPHGRPLRLDPESLPRAEAPAPAVAAEGVARAPELRILDLRRRMEEATVAAAKAGRLPTLRLVSGYSHYGPERFDAFEDELFVGVDIAVPIFDGFRSHHAIEAARSGVEIARLAYRSELDRKRARVRELAEQLETSHPRLEVAERRREAALEEQRLADVNLRAGRGGLRAALLARERLVAARSAAVAARFEVVDIWTRLQRELGRLTAEILGPQLAKAP